MEDITSNAFACKSGYGLGKDIIKVHNVILTKALALINGKSKVQVNTSSDGNAGNFKDSSKRDDAMQSWGKLVAEGVSIIQSDQIKPLLKWLANKK